MQKNFLNGSNVKHLLVVYCLLVSFSASSQIYEAWSKRYNSPFTASDVGEHIAVDNYGNVYVTGRTIIGANLDYTWSMTTIKYDARGVQQWVRRYDNPYGTADSPSDIAVDGNGNVYITGSSGLNNQSDILTLKYNSNGDLLWTKLYDGEKHAQDVGWALALDASGNIYVTGSTNSDYFIYTSDAITIKYNNDGVQQWVATYAGANADSPDAGFAIQVPGDGFVYITGTIAENDAYGDCLTIKYNTAGQLQWVRNWDAPYHHQDFATDIDVDGSGNVYITGLTQHAEENTDYVTVKYDASGNQIWYKAMDSTADDRANNIEVDGMNNIVITGNIRPNNKSNFLTVKYNANGDVIWSKKFIPEDSCYASPAKMVLDNSNNIYITGLARRDNCSRTYYATIKYLPSGGTDWTKYYTGPGNRSDAYDIAVDAKGRVYVIGSSLDGPEPPPFSEIDFSYATVKYSKCIINCPANVVVNNEPGKCGGYAIFPAATTTGDCGPLEYSFVSGTFVSVGTHTVIVSSPSSGESCTFNVTVLDVEAPKITCPAPVTVSCAADVPAVDLNAVTVTDNCSNGLRATHVGDVITNQTCANRFTLTRTYKAIDGSGNTATCSQVITVNDITPPQITGLTLSQQSLWPPNHTMRDITVDYTVTDNCVSNPSVTVSVTSNEPVNGTADGDTDPDWQVVDLHHIKLRAERASNGNGRIYTVTVTVDDGCNPPVSQSKQVFVAHNITGPRTGQPFKIGSTVPFSGVFWDKAGNKHSAKWLLDGAAAANGNVAEPVGNQNGKVTGSYKFSTPGVYKLQMNVTDQTGITSYANTNEDLDAIVVIFDPNGGNAYGGGWFQSAPGALSNNSTAEGKASYGFAVNYKNAAKPKGETQFEFKVGDFEFNALNFDYLSINGAKAQFKGTGKITGGQSGIGFIMTVIDGAVNGSGVDKIRMKIYNRNNGIVYYDNQPGAGDTDDPTTVVGANSLIVIQGSATNNETLTRETSTLESQASISCPGNKIVSPDANSCMATVYNIDPVYLPAGAVVAYHIMGPEGPSTGYGSVSGFSFPPGVSTVRYNLPDFTGVQCEFTITVEDKTPPVFSCPANLTLKCPDEIPLPEPIMIFDPCAPSGYIYAQFLSDVKSNVTCSNKFTLTRTYKATDAAGNTATCAQIITVNDTVPPVFDQGRPEPVITVTCPWMVDPAPYLYAHDECNDEHATVVFKEVKSDSTCPNRFKLTRTWTASDACGNTAQYVQIVNVKDTIPPTMNFNPPHMTLVSCASEIPEAPYVYAEDNCLDINQPAKVILKEVKSDSTCPNKFKLTRTWTATDACGNTATISQLFIVEDFSRPVFDGNEPPLVNVSCEKDIPAPPTQTATDKCGTATITYSESKINVQCANRFTLIRKWIASDGCGNTASRTQTVVVYDDEAPKITGVSATPVVLWPPNHKMRDVMINYTATDNCGTTSTLEVSSSDPINGGSDGDQSPDWEIVDGHHVRLRAEKANNGQARYYTIKVTITDGCNAPVDTSITVVVAHNITSPQTGTPYKVGSNVSFSGVFWDKPGNKHTAKWLVDGSAVTNGTVTEPSGNQNGKVTGNYKFNSPGVYKLQMNVTDQNGVTSYANTNNDLDAIVVIYDPNGGYAYGGGYFNSPAGALRSDPAAEGKASYGFTVNYFKNSTNPKGETQFEFKVGEFEFNALNFDYLVINNAMAQFKGTGKIIGGQSGIGFTMTVTDGQLDGTGIDKIRMKIYNRNNGSVIYDNQFGASDADLPVQAVAPNSTVVIDNPNAGVNSGITKSQAEPEAKISYVSDNLNVLAYPNPTASTFTLNVRSKSAEKITMQVVDMSGRMIETRTINANTNVQFGNLYRPGTYVVRIMQGREQKEIKLVKISD